MKKLIIAASIVLGLGLLAAVYFCISLTMDKNVLAAELETTQNTLATTQAELANTQDTLAATQADLEETGSTLTETSAELSATQAILTSTESELETTGHELTFKTGELATANHRIDSLESSLADTQETLDGMNNLYTIASETLEGLGIDVDTSIQCWDVELVDNPEAQNPTWDQLTAFLAEDQTEKHQYILNEYDCSQFSRDLHNNAETAGIRAAEVNLWFSNNDSGHALNAFITTDYGLVWVDCTETDTIARIKLNKEYRAVDKYSISGQNARNDPWWDSLTFYYYMSNDGGAHSIVSDIMIYW